MSCDRHLGNATESLVWSRATFDVGLKQGAEGKDTGEKNDQSTDSVTSSKVSLVEIVALAMIT